MPTNEAFRASEEWKAVMIARENGRDLLAESGAILNGSTRLLATSAHLDAVTQLVREAKAILEGAEDVSLVDWLKEAEKVL